MSELEKTETKYKYLDILEKSGLSEKEAKLYELLLTHGQMGVHDLVKYEPTLKRTSMYAVLYAIRDHNLIAQTIKGKKIQFKVTDPAYIKSFIHDQQSSLTQADNLIDAVLPDLSNLLKLTTEKPIVRVYEGIEGIKTIYDDTLKEGKEICSFLGLYESHPQILRWLRDHYVKKRVSKKIFAKVLLAVSSDRETESYVERGGEEFRETRIISKEKFPARLEFQVYGHKVSFANHNIKNAPVGIIIENKYIADTMRSLFNLGWDSRA